MESFSLSEAFFYSNWTLTEILFFIFKLNFTGKDSGSIKEDQGTSSQWLVLIGVKLIIKVFIINFS